MVQCDFQIDGFVFVLNGYVYGFVYGCIGYVVYQIVWIFDFVFGEIGDDIVCFYFGIQCWVFGYIGDYCVFGIGKVKVFGDIVVDGLDFDVQLVMVGFVEFFKLFDDFVDDI